MRFTTDRGLRLKLLTTKELPLTEVLLFLLVFDVAISLPFGAAILWIDPLPMLLSVLVVISLSRIPLGQPMALVTLLAAQGLGWLLVPALASFGERWGVHAGLSPGGTLAAIIALLLPRASMERMSSQLDWETTSSDKDPRRPRNTTFSTLLPLLAGASIVLSTYVLPHPEGSAGTPASIPVLPIEIALIVGFFAGLVSGYSRVDDRSSYFIAKIAVAAVVVVPFANLFEANLAFPLRAINSFGSTGYFVGIVANVWLCAIFWMFGLLTRRLATYGSWRVARQRSFGRGLEAVSS